MKEDGITFDPASVKGQEIRKEANYSGIRITLLGTLDRAQCPVQADIGFGDAVPRSPMTQTTRFCWKVCQRQRSGYTRDIQ